jgi:hypothetical protein
MSPWIGLVIAAAVPVMTLAVAWGSIQTELDNIENFHRGVDADVASLQAQFNVFQNAISGAQVRLQNAVDTSNDTAVRLRVLENVISAMRQQSIEDNHRRTGR